MTRPIKFRAFYKWDGSMIPPMDIQKMIHQKVNSFTLQDLYDDMIFMQFTWLLDKNGKEIYESDIIYDTWNAMPGWIPIKSKLSVVEFSNYWFNFWQKHIDRLLIIGNIYENPELLTNP